MGAAACLLSQNKARWVLRQENPQKAMGRLAGLAYTVVNNRRLDVSNKVGELTAGASSIHLAVCPIPVPHTDPPTQTCAHHARKKRVL